MNPNKSDWQEIDSFINVFSQITKNFLSDLDDKKVAELDTHLADCPLEIEGISFQSALETLCDQIIPRLSASRGPRYWGFVTGGATPVATFADWLVASFDQNVAKDGDSIATAVERQTIRWLCELFNLPSTFEGIITTGATASNFLGALCARQFVGWQQNIDVAKEGVFDLNTDILSTTPHASMIKSLSMAGLGQNHVVLVDALSDSEAMDVTHLEQCLKNSDSPGKIIIASAATVTATDFDDLETIARLAKRHNAWLHVDAAFGIFERLLDKKEYLSKGVELADSITLDSHKWLNVTYDSGVFLTRHLNRLFESCDVPAPYLMSESSKPDFMSLGIENSRRFRALPVWLTLLTYGKKGITHWIESNIRLAKLLAQKIDESSSYELVHPCKLNVVLFRPNSEGLTLADANTRTKAYLTAINSDGRVFLSPGVWQGKQIIRAALSNWETQTADIEIALACLTDIARRQNEQT